MCAHGGTEKREPAARATDFAAEKKKELEESIRAEKKKSSNKKSVLGRQAKESKNKEKRSIRKQLSKESF